MTEQQHAEQAEISNEERQKRLGEARTAAQRQIRENHIDEFNEILAKEAKARGVEWQPRKTEEQKAADQIAALLEQHPGLKDQILGTEAGTPETGADVRDFSTS